MSTLTSRERVLRAIDHQETDRVPVQIYMTPEIHQALVRSLGRDPIEAFQIDLRTVGAPRTKGLRRPEPGAQVQYYDEFGVGYANIPNNAGGEYLEAVDLTLARLETMDDVLSYDWPSADDYDYSVVPAQIAANEGFCVCAGHAGQPDIINGVGRGRGMGTRWGLPSLGGGSSSSWSGRAGRWPLGKARSTSCGLARTWGPRRGSR